MAGKQKKEEEEEINPFSELSFLTILLLIYYVVRFFLADKYSIKNSNMSKILTIVAIVILLITQVATAIKVSKIHCGMAQVGKAILYTMIPNIMYMGAILALLYFFPGFKSPFSNTFGYIAILPFVRTTINELLIGEKNKSEGLLKKLYQDESVLVNLLTPTEEGFTKRLENLTKDSDKLKTDWKGTKAEKTLYNLVVIKDMVGEFVWLILGLAITVSTTFNSITAIENCVKGSMAEDALNNIKASSSKISFK